MKYFIRPLSFLVMLFALSACGKNWNYSAIDSGPVDFFIKNNISLHDVFARYQYELNSNTAHSRTRAMSLYIAAHKYADTTKISPSTHLAMVKMEQLQRTWQPEAKAPYLAWQKINETIGTTHQLIRQQWVIDTTDQDFDAVQRLAFNIKTICQLMELTKVPGEEFPLEEQWKTTLSLKRTLVERLDKKVYHVSSGRSYTEVIFKDSEARKTMVLACEN